MTTLKEYENGFRLLHYYDNTTRAVSISFSCLVGGRNEDENNRGIAHLAEHMFFKGSKKRNKKQINQELEKFGIVNNASTSNDLTKYDAEGMDQHAELIFDVFSDCLFNPTYPEDELENERNVVCSELEMYESDFRDKIENVGLAAGLQGTPYEYVLGGTVESVSKITSSDLHKFHNEFYKPERIIISVYGNVTLKEAERLMEKYILPYGLDSKKPFSYKMPSIDINIKDRFKFASKDTDQVFAMFNFKSINASSEDLTTLNAVRLTIASTFSSRLFIKLREEKGLVYTVSGYVRTYPECGLNSIRFITNASNAVEVTQKIKETLISLKENGFSEDELVTFKNIMKTSLTLSLQSLDEKIYYDLKNCIYRDSIIPLEDRLKEIDKITLQGMNETFKKYYDFNYLTVGVVSKQNNIDYLKILQN